MKIYGPYCSVFVKGHYRPIADDYDILYRGDVEYRDLINIIKKYDGSIIEIHAYSFENAIGHYANDIKNDIKNGEKFSVIAGERDDSSNNKKIFKKYSYLGNDYVQNCINSFSEKYKNKTYSKRMITKENIEETWYDISHEYKSTELLNVIEEIISYSCEILNKKDAEDYFRSKEYKEAILSFKNIKLQKHLELKREIIWVVERLMEFNRHSLSEWQAPKILMNYAIDKKLFEDFGKDYKIYDIDEETIFKSIAPYCGKDIVCLANISRNCYYAYDGLKFISQNNYHLPRILNPVSKAIYHALSPEKENNYCADERAFTLYGFFRDMGNYSSEYSIGNYNIYNVL